MSTHSTSNFVLVFGFVAVITLPWIDSVIPIDPYKAQVKPSHQEPKKNLVQAIKRKMEHEYGMKNVLLTAHAHLKYDLMGKSPNDAVLIGNEGWFFLASEKTLDDYRNVTPMSSADQAIWVEELDKRRTHAQTQGSHYLFVVAPNKHSIYSEHIPGEFQKVNETSRFDGLLAALRRKNQDYPILDLRPDLIAAKSFGRIYHKTDTHWNSLGAFLAHRSIINSLLDSWPQLKLPVSPPEFEKTPWNRGGDLARLMGLMFDLREVNIEPSVPIRTVVDQETGKPYPSEIIDIAFRERVVTSCPRGEIESAVIIHDSFGVILIPYLAQHFKRAVFVWDDAYTPDVIEAEKPKIIIQEIVERRLHNQPAPWEPSASR